MKEYIGGRNENKQIEEMANCINEMDEPNAHYYGRNMKMHEAFADCFTIAKHLYKAGYRKQSEGEWVYLDYYSIHRYDCSACGAGNNQKTPYCPNCGARMSGGKNEY